MTKKNEQPENTDGKSKTLTSSKFYVFWETAGEHSNRWIVFPEDIKQWEKKISELDDNTPAPKKPVGFVNLMHHLFANNIVGYDKKALKQVEKICDKKIIQYSKDLKPADIPKYPKKKGHALRMLANSDKKQDKVAKKLKLELPK